MFYTTETLMAEESSSSSVVSNVNSRSLQIRRDFSTLVRGPRKGMFSLEDTEDDVQFDSESIKVMTATKLNDCIPYKGLYSCISGKAVLKLILFCAQGV